MNRLERIKSISIDDIAERYGYELIGKGKTLTVRGDKSLVFYPNTNSYTDFSQRLGAGGSVIDFVMQHESIDFNAALDMLDDGNSDYTAPAPRIYETQTDTTFADGIKAQNLKDITPALALHGLKELYPFITDATPFQHLLGWSHYNNSLTFEYPNLSINRRTSIGKWIGTPGNKRDYIPHKIDNGHYVYLYSGMSERIAVEAMGINYIGLQMDTSDTKITDAIITAMKGKTLVILEENDDSSRKLSQRLRKKFRSVKIMRLGEGKEYGYDLRDFVNDNGSFELSRMLIDRLSDMLPLEEVEVLPEIIIPYDGKYISSQNEVNINALSNCVIVALTGSGKTYSFKNEPGTIILVPRVLQTDTGKGDNTDYLINKVLSEGATITYEKFLGHYTNKHSGEFKHYVDNNRFKIIVDEAHMIQKLRTIENKDKTMIDGYEIIYNLDAVFMSGTIEPFFRADLQRYKFKPRTPTTIYYTDGEVPNIENALYFVDRPKPLMRNYPLNCVVGAEHKFNNFNVHQHTHGKVFTTSALREGISIDTGTFDACIVNASLCSLWSVKDAIQALNRPRGDKVIRVITKPIEKPSTVFADFEYFNELSKSVTDTQEINTIMGEEYSNFTKKTHKGSRYLNSTEFGVVCYLAEKTRDQYDPDLYRFEKYTPEETFEVNIETDVEPENVIMLQHTIKNDVYEYPSNKRDPFMKWARHKESGTVDRVMRMSNFDTFHGCYERSSIAKDVKAKYNHSFNRGDDPRKYTKEQFYKLVRSLVQIEITINGEKIERISKNINLDNVKINIVNECPIDGVNLVFNTSLYKVIALNCSANTAHTAKTPIKVGWPEIQPKTSIKKVPKVAENVDTYQQKEVKPPPDKLNPINEAFLDEISELTK